MVSVSKLVTYFVKDNKFGVKVEVLTEGSREQVAEASATSATLISVDKVRTFVTMDELGQYAEVVLSQLSEQLKDAMVIEGQEVLIFAQKEVEHSKCS